MGAWGDRSFDNDTILDWVNDFMREPGLETVRRALGEVVNLDADEYLDADPSSDAVGAAEVVAALLKRPNPGLPEEIQEWVGKQTKDVERPTIELAVRAMMRVESNSELQELYDEAGYDEGWHKNMLDLIARLKS